MSLLIKVKSKLFSAKMNLTKLGIRGYLVHLFSRFVRRNSGSTVVTHQKIDVLSFYDFVLDRPFGNENISEGLEDRRTINWTIPDFNIGSGGHINIFRMIDGLEKRNYQCSITIVGPCQFHSGTLAEECINKNFRPLNAKVYIGWQNMPESWITFATSWTTAYVVRNFQATAHRCYFVQDFEPYFYAQSSDYRWAEATYNFGFYGITAGKWLAQKLSQEYGMITDHVGFSYDKELYAPSMTPIQTSNRRIFFYARSVTPRRGFELGLLALAEVSKRFPDVEFVLAGWDTTAYEIPFKHTSLGVVPLKDLSNVYGGCYAAVVLSFTNLSLLPLELMACRCPVISNIGANVEWLLDEQNALLAQPTVEGIARAVCWLLDNPDKREELAEAGLQFARSTSWDTECNKFLNYIDRLGLLSSRHSATFESAS